MTMYTHIVHYNNILFTCIHITYGKDLQKCHISFMLVNNSYKRNLKHCSLLASGKEKNPDPDP